MSDTIRILVAPTAEVVSKGLAQRGVEAVVEQIDLKVLQQNLNQLTQDVNALFANPPTGDGFNLKQVAVGAEISASGGVTLIGTLNVGAKAAITLTFERS